MNNISRLRENEKVIKTLRKEKILSESKYEELEKKLETAILSNKQKQIVVLS